jgi:hypothetical protein
MLFDATFSTTPSSVNPRQPAGVISTATIGGKSDGSNRMCLFISKSV